ncbi:MAG: hypothetical protein M1539_03190 [Actinobacteria bacterium]|nr:hypothetical protein [Actinomycetota bacterium]
MKTDEATKIEIPYPDIEAPLQLRISVGACRLRISPEENTAGAWITGSYEDPGGGLASKIVDEGDGMVRITQKGSISAIKMPFSGAPQLELVLGKARPFTLIVETGASESSLELGGLPLIRLVIKKGAGKSEIDFSEPNPIEMDNIDISAGAVTMVMRNLANANMTRMALDGGAATYDFDFGGELHRDASVKLTAGASLVKVRVPATTAAKITPGSVLGSLDIGDGLAKKEGAFWTEAALAGKTPVLSVLASMALGSLSLQVTGGS